MTCLPALKEKGNGAAPDVLCGARRRCFAHAPRPVAHAPHPVAHAPRPETQLRACASSRPRGAPAARPEGTRAGARSCSRQVLPQPRALTRTSASQSPICSSIADAAHPRQAPARYPQTVAHQLSPERREDGRARRRTSRSSLRPARNRQSRRTPSSHGPRSGGVTGGGHGHPRSPGACSPVSHCSNLLDNASCMNFLSFAASLMLPGVTAKYGTHPQTQVSETASEGTHLRWSYQMLHTSS